MDKERILHRRMLISICALVVLLVIIVLNFSIHVVRTNRFNEAIHTLSAHEQGEAVSVSSDKTGEWPKADALVPGVTNGGTYEFSVTNLEDYDVSDWTLRLDITQECYLNQAWNGVVEIHQNVRSGSERVDTVDLHNFDIDYGALNIESTGQGKNDLMIHLNEGDYLIYHPLKNSVTNECPLGERNRCATIGMIFYYDTSFNVPECELTYRFSKTIFQGTEFIIFVVLSLLWILIFSEVLVWAVVRRRAEKELADREAFLEEAMGLITSFVDAKDAYTKGHSNRVADYTVLLAKKLGMNERETRNAFYAATLHDIGKCYVPDAILKKSGRLTDEEFDVIKTHTIHGGEMLKSMNSISHIAEGAKYHHERYDGKGYPEGLRGEEIPYIGRVICVADAFDAMTSSRCYRAALSKEKVVRELEDNLGKQFDPVIGEAMLELIEGDQITIPAWENESASSAS